MKPKRMMLNLALIAAGLAVVFPGQVKQLGTRLLGNPLAAVGVDVGPPPPSLVRATDDLVVVLKASPEACQQIQGFYSALAAVLDLGGLETTQDIWQLNRASTAAMIGHGVEFNAPIGTQVDNVIRAAWQLPPDEPVPQRQLTADDLAALETAYLACEYAVRKSLQ